MRLEFQKRSELKFASRTTPEAKRRGIRHSLRTSVANNLKVTIGSKRKWNHPRSEAEWDNESKISEDVGEG